MTHEITPPDHYVAGESLTQEFTIEEDGAAKDISGADIEWQLVPTRGADADAALLDGDAGGVTVEIADAPSGRIDVTIDQDTTTDLAGRRLSQRLIVDDDGPGKQIWGGRFTVLDV
jgi:hypothetical protein